MDLRRELPATVALAALSAAVAGGLTRVFRADAWVVPVMAAAVAPHAIGLVTRARPLVWSVAGWVGGLVALLVWGLVPATTWFGVPTADTVHALSRRLDAGLTTLRNHTAPVAARPGPVLLAVVAIWCMAAIAEYLAFRRRASIGALAPAATIVIWVAALAADAEDHLGAAMAVVVAGAAFLALQHQRLLTERGAAVGSVRAIPARGALAGALALGAAAAVVAALVVPALPGAGADPLVDLQRNDRGLSTYQTAVPPLVDVADNLRRGDRIELFTVQASEPQYWRTVALDQYSDVAGGQWTLRASGDQISRGLTGTPPAGSVAQDFRISALTERWMPAAFSPVSVSRSDTLVVDPSLTLVTQQDSVSRLHYRVVSTPPSATVTDAERRATAAAPPPELARYTQLPDRVPESVRALARTITAGATNAYDRARLLRDYFRSGEFTYDPTVDLSDEANATVAFLRDKRGFCVQFASTYALMARAVGVPARVAVGFTPGALDPATGRYTVTNYDAHAWPEVWLAGIGWTNRFEPTPPSTLPGGSALPGDTAAAPAPGATAPGTPSTTIGTSPTTPNRVTPDGSPATVPGAAPSPAPAPSASSTGSNVLTTVGLALLIVLGGAAAIAAVPLAKQRRRAARRRRPDPAARVAGAWEEAVDRLRELGRPPPRTETPAEVVSRSTALVGDDAARALDALAGAHTSAQFSAGGAGDTDAAAAWADLDAFGKALGRHVGLPRRLRARLAITSLRRHHTRV